MNDNQPLIIDCESHSKRIAAVVCGHMIQVKDRVVGFVENNSDPSDLQAWCDQCEVMFLSEGDKTDAFEAFNDRAIVCNVCYADLKAKHSRHD